MRGQVAVVLFPVVKSARLQIAPNIGDFERGWLPDVTRDIGLKLHGSADSGMLLLQKIDLAELHSRSGNMNLSMPRDQAVARVQVGSAGLNMRRLRGYIQRNEADQLIRQIDVRIHFVEGLPIHFAI